MESAKTCGMPLVLAAVSATCLLANRARLIWRIETMTTLTIEDAFNNLSFYKSGHFPKQEVRCLLKHPEEVTPLLLQELDDVLSRHEQVPAEYMRHLYALYVLAHFRCEQLFPKIMALLQLPGEGASNLLGSGTITGYGLANVIASTFNGDLSLLTAIIEDPTVDHRVRVCALSSITPLVFLGRLEPKTALDYLTQLGQSELEKKQWLLSATLVEITMDLYLEKLKPIILEFFGKGLVDGYCSQDEFTNYFDAREDHRDWRDERMARNYHFVDAINDMQWWDCFQSKATLKKRATR